MCAVKYGKKIKGKLENRGQEMVFVGYPNDRPRGTYRLINMNTKKIVMSRDVVWLDVMLGDY